MKILIVLTSHDQLGDIGKKTGFWLEEFAAPYYVLKAEKRSTRKPDRINEALPHRHRCTG